MNLIIVMCDVVWCGVVCGVVCKIVVGMGVLQCIDVAARGETVV